jgi:hypothetical protein
MRERFSNESPFHTEDSLRGIVKGILGNKSAISIPYPGFGISNEALYSPVEYHNCNAVVLFAGEHAMLSHFPGTHDDPSDPRKSDPNTPYISKLLASVDQITGPSKRILAAIVGGERSHFDFNKSYLISQGVPIIGEFQEDYDQKGNWTAKKVYVSAKEGLVLVDSDKSGLQSVAIRGPAY